MKSNPQLRPPPASYRVVHAVVGPVVKALGVSCRDAYELCSVQMDRELAAGETFRLRVHLMTCGICRHLPDQFRGLRELVRACEPKHGGEGSDPAELAPDVKERIIRVLKNS